MRSKIYPHFWLVLVYQKLILELSRIEVDDVVVELTGSANDVLADGVADYLLQCLWEFSFELVELVNRLHLPSEEA